MRSSASLRTWGPSPLFLLPLIAIALGLAWTVWSSDRAAEPQATATVTALKPVIDLEGAAERPVEVSFGVPSARTLMLWRPFWPPAG